MIKNLVKISYYMKKTIITILDYFKMLIAPLVINLLLNLLNRINITY